MDNHRIGHGKRETAEVSSTVEVRLDEPGDYEISIKAAKEEPGLGLDAINLFEHMFQQIYHHGLMGGYIRVFETIAREARFNLYGYVKYLGGIRNDHHKLEAFSKAFGRTLHNITRIYEPARNIIPSTKKKID